MMAVVLPGPDTMSARSVDDDLKTMLCRGPNTKEILFICALRHGVPIYSSLG